MRASEARACQSGTSYRVGKQARQEDSRACCFGIGVPFSDRCKLRMCSLRHERKSVRKTSKTAKPSRATLLAEQENKAWVKRTTAAKQSFLRARVGARVEMTDYGIERLRSIRKGPTTGNLVSVDFGASSIVVRMTGRKMATSFYIGFWKPASRERLRPGRADGLRTSGQRTDEL